MAKGKCARVTTQIKSALVDAEDAYQGVSWGTWQEERLRVSSGSEGSDGVGPVTFDMAEPGEAMAKQVQALAERLTMLE